MIEIFIQFLRGSHEKEPLQCPSIKENEDKNIFLKTLANTEFDTQY